MARKPYIRTVTVALQPNQPFLSGQVDDDDTGAVSLSWVPGDVVVGAPVASYRVYQNGAFVESVVGTVWTTVGLPGGVAYNYTVEAVSTGGVSSAPSNTVTLAWVYWLPNTPSSILIAPDTPIGTTVLDASFYARHPIPGTQIYYTTDENLSWLSLQGASVITDETPVPAGTYDITIDADDWQSTAPDLSVTSVQYYAVALAWTAVDGAISYSVERSVSGGPFTAIGGGTSLTFTDSQVSESSSYQYRVRALLPSGYGDYSSIAEASTPARPIITGVEEDWLYRSGQDPANPQPGVVFAHDFRAEGERLKFRYTSKDSLRIAKTTDLWADPPIEDTGDARLGGSRALVHRLIGTYLTRDALRADTRLYVADNSQIPDPAVVGHPYGIGTTYYPRQDAVLLGTEMSHQGEYSNIVTVNL